MTFPRNGVVCSLKKTYTLEHYNVLKNRNENKSMAQDFSSELSIRRVVDFNWLELNFEQRQ